MLTCSSFIHGGAWRDESQDKAEIGPALKQLLSSFDRDEASSCLRHVAGVASINYRLSGGPNDNATNGLHPDHIEDVLKGLAFLEREYGVGKQWPYIVVGHSCGATLAFQIGMDQQWNSAAPHQVAEHNKVTNVANTQASEHQVSPPVAVVGLEGIYDFLLLLKNHADQDAYKQLIEDAFGSNEEVWIKASPVAGDYSNHWPKGDLVVLGHSLDDELVEWAQVDSIVKVLQNQGWKIHSDSESKRNGGKQCFVLHLKGTHDEVWEKGAELARTIEFAIRILFDDE